MIEEVKLLLGDSASNYSDDLIGLMLKMAIAEVEDYTHRELDYSLQLIAERIAIIKLNRIGTEGLNSMSVNGMSENYINGYPDDIIATLNAKRKIRVM